MRLLKINLLVAALLVFGAATSSAFRVDFSTSDFGTTINQGETVTLNVIFDTEGANDVALLGVGVLFDTGVFTYRPDLSSTTTYLFFTGKGAYLVPSSTCGGSTGTACNLFPTRPSQVQIDFQSSSLPSGTVSGGVGQLVSLVFEATGAGQGAFQFDFDPFFGSILQLGDTTNPPLGLGAGGTVTVVPEPTTALLVGLGLVGLGVAGRRSRS